MTGLTRLYPYHERLCLLRGGNQAERFRSVSYVTGRVPRRLSVCKVGEAHKPTRARGGGRGSASKVYVCTVHVPVHICL